MAPLSRFGASKFRNAIPHVPPREEWYRGSLPTGSSGSTTSSTLGTFSSEVKTTRQWVVALSATGDLSYRRYDAVGGDAVVGKMKVGSGGGVGDWDVSGLEDGTVVVGGLDGTIHIYELPSGSDESLGPLNHVHTIPGSSPITNLALHPTTPSILLASSQSAIASIYDLSKYSTEPVISLTGKEPKGLWSLAWSPDGRKVAAVGKSGTAYIWDPRQSPQPLVTRTLPIQALKPSRLVWVGTDLFVTAFSKMRNREYHLFSGETLSTIFTNTLDTSNGLLIPIVDQERRIVYLSARGDMSLSQVELSGPQGYQETLHSLPSQLASTSLALAHPSTLPVMAAQIGTIVLSTIDKDGDALIPFGIRVPRRQLIDFHEDLYPEIVGTVPEQTAAEWLKGEDRAPLLISLDPSRRGMWEQRIVETSRSPASAAVQDTARKAAPVSEAKNLEAEHTPAELPAKTASPPAAPPAADNLVGYDPVAADAKPVDPSLPLLEAEETYASTSYKARIMGKHISGQLDQHRKSGSNGPLMVGLQGPQGCGKTTLCNALLSYLQGAPLNLKIAVLSLDDLYKTHEDLKGLATRHAGNSLLSGRGPPGTHDVELACRILDKVEHINESGQPVQLPIFDKSLCGGEGDRSKDTVGISGPLDVFILEGWSFGFDALSEEDLRRRIEGKSSLSDTTYFLSQPEDSLVTLSQYLADFASKVYSPFHTVVQVEPESYKYVFDWRLEQEINMKAANGGRGMTDAQVHAFVGRYMPGYELWSGGVWEDDKPWTGKGLRIRYGKDREVVKVEIPKSTPAPSRPSVAKATAETQATPTRSAEPSKPTPVSVQAPTSAGSLSASAPTTAKKPTSSERYNPGWSRKFLAGKTPLIPSYDQLPTLSTLHQDSQILKVTPHLALFPIQGPGGRIGVQPLKKKGRVATGGEGYLSGGVEVTDFAVEPFTRDGTCRVALAGEDGGIRVWAVGEDGVHGAGPEPQQVLKGDGIDKIASIAFHPAAQDLLVVASNDRGTANIRLFDLAAGKEHAVIPLEGFSGIFNFACSLFGDRIAVATKDGKIGVLDPRQPSSLVAGKAHDSPRSFQIAWIDCDHLLSVGFSKGSQRRINLYKLPTTASGEIETIHSLLIDVSPSVLFPVHDPDTSILYVWGKGERQIQAYEIHPENKIEPIAKLPSFTSGSPQLGLGFLPKRLLDVRKVEVAKCLRLTAKTIEEVTFSIPRNKPDFFQDDIYVDTIDVERPACSAVEWLSGSDSPPHLRSLQPDGMTPLSQAPQTTTKPKTKFVPAKDILSEEEKKKREMDALFAKAKINDSSDEDDEPPRTGLAPPDDDW